MTFLFPLLIVAGLVMEGFLIARMVLGKRDRLLLLALALPVASLPNVLLFLLFTLAGMPLRPLALVVGHLLLLAVLISLRVMDIPSGGKAEGEKTASGRIPRTLLIVCTLLLTIHALYGFTHAVLLPTAQIDSLNNWNMRSQISFYDRALAFDSDVTRGMEKPHYPFLFHGLQIMVNQGQKSWNDMLANAIHFLLFLSSFSALFLLLRRLSGGAIALLGVTVLTGVPLIALHLGQGYADLMLLQFAVLSLACLLLCIREGHGGWLLLSALFAAAAVWTKEEGLSFVLLPWLCMSMLLFWRTRPLRPSLLRGVGLAIALGGAFPLFALLKGFRLTPHSNDASLAFNSQALLFLPKALLGMGSFGIVWYALPLAILFTFLSLRHAASSEDRKCLLTFLWGGVVCLFVLCLYVLTPNAVALLNGTGFYRQLFTPIGLLLVSLLSVMHPKET